MYEEEVIVTVKFKVKRDHVEDFKQELTDTIEDFIDDSIAVQEGDIIVEEINLE